MHIKRARPFISTHTAIKIYRYLIDHILITSVLFGMVSRLAGITYRLEGQKQKANLMYKCVDKLASVDLCDMFTPKISS